MVALEETHVESEDGDQTNTVMMIINVVAIRIITRDIGDRKKDYQVECDK